MPRHDVPSQISASDFKATCLEVMDEVARTGVELIVTKHGRPWVRLSAVGKTCDSPWGFLAGSVVRHDDIVSSDEASWVTSPTEPLSRLRRR